MSLRLCQVELFTTFFTLKSISIVQKYKELWVYVCCGFVAKVSTLQMSIIPIAVKGSFMMVLLSGNRYLHKIKNNFYYFFLNN